MRHCKKCISYICIHIYYKSDKVQLEGCICEVNSGYTTKMAEYADSHSDVTKLCESGY